MNSGIVDRIVAATLYEGYILYPYRASSVKNQVRWTFGGVFPRDYSEAVGGSEPFRATTECLVRGGDDADVEVRVRFLHVVTRTAARLFTPLPDPPDGPPPAMERLPAMVVGGVTRRSWEEAAERELDAGTRSLGALLAQPQRLSLTVAAGTEVEWLRDADGTVTAALLREHEPLVVSVDIRAARSAPGIATVRVSITNDTPVSAAQAADRKAALRHTLVSTHAILGVGRGQWLSLADPPADAIEAAAACRNTGLWPVLVGEPGSADTILASPIILEDHPQLAPESPGDLFDATEIDEILSLRILALTDEEKDEMRSADDRARAVLERTENLTQNDFMRMHGVVRPTGPLVGGGMPDADPWSSVGEDPFAERPHRESVRWSGGMLRVGDRVRLQPRGGADALDLVLRGRTATIESIEQDYEDVVYLAVVVDDDPGADLGMLRQPGHRFFFTLDDIAAVDDDGVVTQRDAT